MSYSWPIGLFDLLTVFGPLPIFATSEARYHIRCAHNKQILQVTQSVAWYLCDSRVSVNNKA